jgi:YD repeat-containing protein
MSFVCFIIWIVFAIAVSIAATRHYQRSGFGWFVLAVLISPLLAWLLLLLLGTNPDRQWQPQPQRGVNWKAVDWSTGEIVKPRPVSMEPAYIEPMSRTAMWFWLSLVGVMLAGLLLLAIVTNAGAAEQSRVYAPDGRSIGTVVPQGDGSNRFYDARGNSRGTSTTTGNTTKDYDARGNVLGTTSAPRGDRLR